MESSISSKKRTKTRRIVVKTNSFVRFLEEFMAWQFAFEINWPLVLASPYLQFWFAELICLLLIVEVSSKIFRFRKKNQHSFEHISWHIRQSSTTNFMLAIVQNNNLLDRFASLRDLNFCIKEMKFDLMSLMLSWIPHDTSQT